MKNLGWAVSRAGLEQLDEFPAAPQRGWVNSSEKVPEAGNTLFILQARAPTGQPAYRGWN
jgi:hypothetical protein